MIKSTKFLRIKTPSLELKYRMGMSLVSEQLLVCTVHPNISSHEIKLEKLDIYIRRQQQAQNKYTGRNS